MKRIIISGFFSILHEGHIDYIRESAKLGDELYVIVNSDQQTKLKKSIPTLDEQERLSIICALKNVHYALISIDEDNSVSETIKLLHSTFTKNAPNQLIEWAFVNGGDRSDTKCQNIQEIKVCNNLGIDIIGLPDKKKNSSSWIIEKVAKEWVKRKLDV